MKENIERTIRARVESLDGRPGFVNLIFDNKYEFRVGIRKKKDGKSHRAERWSVGGLGIVSLRDLDGYEADTKGISYNLPESFVRARIYESVRHHIRKGKYRDAASEKTQEIQFDDEALRYLNEPGSGSGLEEVGSGMQN